MNESASRWRLVAFATLAAALIVHALWSASDRISSDDFFWDLAAGRWIVEHDALPKGDVYSYTHEGAPWQNGEWLSHVVFYETYRRWGGSGVAAFKLSAFCAVFALIAWTGWRRCGSFVLGTGAAIAASYVCRPYFDLRSQIFLFLEIAALLAVLEAYRRGAEAWILALLPLLTAVWVNVHYSFLFGVGTIGLYAGSEAAKSYFGLPDRPLSRDRVLRLAAAAVASAAATLLNPYHVLALTYPLLLLIGPEERWRYDFLEWLPPVFFVEQPFNPVSFGYYFLAQAAVAAAALLFAWRRFDLTDALLVGVTTSMALSTRRFVPLFALVAAPFLARNAGLLRDRLLPRLATAPELATRGGAFAVIALSMLITGVLLAHAVPAARANFARGVFEGLVGADYFPAGAVEFLRRNELPGRLFHPYTWGGYLMFQNPDRKVFIDGRAQTVYTFDFYLEGQIPERGQPGWSGVLDRWQVALVAWPSSPAHGERYQPLLRLLSASPNWVRVYDDGHTAVFAHQERGRDWVEDFRRFALAYPDVAGAQLFLGRTLLDAGEYERSRSQLQATIRRFPKAVERVRAAEATNTETARVRDSGPAWFGVAFFRDVLGDHAGAADAYRRALERGLGDPRLTLYAQHALQRAARP